MLLCNVEEGIVEFLTTVSLSTNTLAEFSIGTPIILKLYLSAFICSVAIRNATNSDLKVEVSTVFCVLEYQMIGALFKYINMHVCERRFILFHA
jgi:hypothetical protein